MSCDNIGKAYCFLVIFIIVPGLLLSPSMLGIDLPITFCLFARYALRFVEDYPVSLLLMYWILVLALVQLSGKKVYATFHRLLY